MMNNVPKRIENAQYQELPEENELMVVCEDSGQVKVLNAAAGGIWLLCDGRRSIREMCDLLRGSHPEADMGTLTQQVTTVLDFLKGEDLIR